MDQNVSLVEAIQALAAEMAKASSEAEAETGLKKLRQLRAEHLGKENDPGAVNAARRDAEALIAWLEARLEQLKAQLARRRRAQEGEVMEQIAKQRETEGPSLLPTELVDAIVHATQDKDPEEVTSTAPAAPAKPEGTPGEKKPPAKGKEKPARKKEQAPAEPQSGPAAEPAQPTPEKPTPEKPAPAQTEPAKPAPEKPTPAPATPKPEKPEFTRYERLAAHLAASVGENSYFFERLRKTAKRECPAKEAPKDDGAAEAHYRTVHDLNKRLVNLELHAKAIARARERREPVSNLVRTAARELKSFLRDYKAAREERPDMAGDYERRFGGWADQFTAMKPEKGSAILDLCRAERQPQKPAPEKAPEREADAPQLVLKRDDYWQQ